MKPFNAWRCRSLETVSFRFLFLGLHCCRYRAFMCTALHVARSPDSRRIVACHLASDHPALLLGNKPAPLICSKTHLSQGYA